MEREYIKNKYGVGGTGSARKKDDLLSYGRWDKIMERVYNTNSKAYYGDGG